MKLNEVLIGLDALDQHSYVLVPPNTPLTLDTSAMVVPIPEDAAADLGVEGFDYFISVFGAKDVLETWSAWRGGRTPTPVDALAAIIYYQENDTYLPAEEMKQKGFE